METSPSGRAAPDGPVAFRETTERFLFLRLITEVRESGVYVRLAPLQRSFRRFPSGDIRDVEATSYEATTYTGWHWGVHLTASGNRVYRLRGGDGVEIVRSDGRRWFVGSRRPRELESAIERVRAADDAPDGN